MSSCRGISESESDGLERSCSVEVPLNDKGGVEVDDNVDGVVDIPFSSFGANALEVRRKLLVSKVVTGTEAECCC
ncbi:unnamed protein product [Hydatigera taeniaeformis]|uniref:Uncharacterized protein n=1 Tax=Hydatigena taeniaeformis TaxID=6205 RepID=A0A3P7GZ32_HYDTA|nr:unnamed protein product [Hydatigera taeniaeformis]